VTKSWRKTVIAFVFAPALLLSGCASWQSADVGERRAAPSVSQADAATRAALRLQLALSYYRQGQFSVAIEEAGLALQAKPERADAYSVRALAYAASGQSGLAESDFRRALSLQPDSPDFANNYGWFLCAGDDVTRVAEAMAYFEQALQNPGYRSPAGALANAGACSLKAGNTVVAERYFLRGLQYAPASPLINVNLGKLYFDRDEFEMARVHIGLVAKNTVLMPDVLWLAIRIERKLGNQAAENELAAQLRRRYPSSSEYAAYQRGAFDE
jgi:type IV pilus assembly protein PilF